jgi:uncharacterized membrane protein
MLSEAIRLRAVEMAVARALHVLAVVIWIGGVSMVTVVILPAIRRGEFGSDWLGAFQAVEHRFVWVARTALIVVGLSGLYLVAVGDLWDRFLTFDLWWMHAMVCLWLLFAIILFIGEPFIVRDRFARWASREPERAFARIHRAHWILLGLSLITIFGVVTGVQGWPAW